MGSPYTKGHKNYYFGKKIPSNQFRDVWDLYGTHQISKTKAAQMLGVSRPTFCKWAKQIIMHGDIDSSLSFLIWEED